MASVQDTPAHYSASCNPPRRAKRPRTQSMDYAEPPTLDLAAAEKLAPRRSRPRILPKAPAPDKSPEAVESDDDDVDDYEPSGTPAAPKRRGRKPGALSRSARESLRKLNHSRIEKARRTKINETLATLSTLVNDAERQRGGPIETVLVAEDAELEKRTGKGKMGEKEFKLDVLIKTVAYVQELIAKVQTYESGQCPNCSGDPRPLPPAHDACAESRSSANVEDDMEVDPDAASSTRDEEESYAGYDEKGSADAEERLLAPQMTTSQPLPSPLLPSIASWLPHPYVDPSCLVSLSSPSAQLPSPPPSGRLGRASSSANVPALNLPGPAHPVAPAVTQRRTHSPATRLIIPASAMNAMSSADARGRRSSSSAGSPAWTPEDETAASLLLQMSSSPRSISSATSASARLATLVLPKAVEPEVTWDADRTKESRRERDVAAMQVQTPSSLFGLTKR